LFARINNVGQVFNLRPICNRPVEVFVSVAARQLFRNLADVPPMERARILADNRVPDEVCAELEALFSYDSGPQESITSRVQAVAHRALSPAARPRYCGPYRLVKLLGYGGMGSVYLAERRDGEIEQTVAIKLLRADADRPSWRGRFLKERQLLAYLNHPAIARLLDAGHTEDGQPYLAMEYVEGVAIDEYATPLDLRGKLELFLSVCVGFSPPNRL
jgi:serine/threonine protein kinase